MIWVCVKGSAVDTSWSIALLYLKSVDAEHVCAETLGSESMADRRALVNDNDTSILELFDVFTRCIDTSKELSCGDQIKTKGYNTCDRALRHVRLLPAVSTTLMPS